MKLNTTSIPFALAVAARTASKTGRPGMRINPVPPHFSHSARHVGFPTARPPGSRQGKATPALIYAVDDLPALADLYQGVLSAAGYRVKIFQDRLEALSALKAEPRFPDLLITDYLGLSMAIDDFLHSCREIRPGMRLLMASGFDAVDLRFRGTRPDCFLRKPFTFEELQNAVEAALRT